jgi:hypothetical protein
MILLFSTSLLQLLSKSLFYKKMLCDTKPADDPFMVSKR